MDQRGSYSIRFWGMVLQTFFAVSMQGQNRATTGSILFLAGNGFQSSTELFNDESQPYQFLESFVDVTVELSPFNAWVQGEYSSPPQIGPSALGIRKARVSYKSPTWDIQVGDIYGQFGRGLSLKFWEDQSIDFDSVLRGLWLNRTLSGKSAIDFVTGKVSGGRHLAPGPGINLRNRDYSDDAWVTGARYNLNIPTLASGFSFYWVRVLSNNEWFSPIPDIRDGGYQKLDSELVSTHTNQPGIVFEFSGESFDMFLETSYRINQLSIDSLYASSLFRWVQLDKRQEGRNIYWSSSIYHDNIAITTEYKNYLLDASDPDIRAHAPLRLGRQTPIQSPPTAIREQNSVLISRNPKLVDFEDEIGYQIELVAVVGDISLIINHASASRQNQYQYNQTERSWDRQELKSFLPSREASYYPFRNYTGQVNFYIPSVRADVTAQLNYTDETVSDRSTLAPIPGEVGVDFIAESIEKRNVWTSISQVLWPISDSWSAAIDFEYQWERIIIEDETDILASSPAGIGGLGTSTSDSFPIEHRYASVSLARNATFSIGILSDWSSRVFTNAGSQGSLSNNFFENSVESLGFDLTNTWTGIFGAIHLGSARRLDLYYGSQRGGIRCESGVCVFVPGINDAATIRYVAQF